MELRELSPTEQLVLVGLVKAVVHADQEVTREETAVIRALAQECGTEAWNQRVADARVQLATAEQLFDLARQVTRVDARECIHAALRRLAEADQLAQTEEEILQWVAEIWQLGAQAAPRAEDEALDDEDTFDEEFVLFDVDSEPEAS